MIDQASRTTRLRGRRTLRQSIWGLEYVPARSARRLLGWLDRLSDLPRDDWLAVANAVRSDPSRRVQLAAARQRLDAVLSEQRLELVAWFVRDFVDTEVHHALHGNVAPDRESRGAASAARDAACLAALAIAARDWLTDSDYYALSAPFAIVIGT